MSKKILIADDSSVIQTLTKKILITLDYDVMGVKNGNKVMPLIDKHDFDVILMDINLPSVDGVSLTKEIDLWQTRKKQMSLLLLFQVTTKTIRKKILMPLALKIF